METLRVLVVDDELGMRLGVMRALKDHVVSFPDIDGDVNFALEQAETAEQAFDIIGSVQPDILLLDYKLPGMSGLELLDRVRSLEGDMLTIMITAYASLETAVSAVKRGAYDFIAKPFTPEELKNTIRKAAGRLLLARQARRLAREKRRVRFEFIRVVAHELKAPLGAIEGYLNILQDIDSASDSETHRRIVERCVVRITGMRKMIGDLLDLTRIESGQLHRDLVETDVREIAETAMATFRPEAGERNITLALHCEKPLSLIADRVEIEIIFNNLISNALKYNRDGGRVDVTVSGGTNETVITVADTGIGMSEEELAKLFNEFVRIKNEKTKNILGSGLGLSTVKKLATLYNGEATAESTPDVGSTFMVILREPEPPEEIDEEKTDTEFVT